MIDLGVLVKEDKKILQSNHYVFSKYAHEIQRLDHQGTLLSGLSNEFLDKVHFEKGMKVLDLGCGTGSFTFLISERVGPSGKIVGVDKSVPVVERAKHRAMELGFDNTDFVVADIEKEEIRGEFDAVVGRFILSFLDSPVDSLRAICDSQDNINLLVFQEWQLDSPPYTYPQSNHLLNYHKKILETMKRAGVAMDMGLKLLNTLTKIPRFERFLIESRQFVGNSSDREFLEYLEQTGAALIESMLDYGLITSPKQIDELLFSALEEVKRNQAVLCLNPIVGVAARRNRVDERPAGK